MKPTHPFIHLILKNASTEPVLKKVPEVAISKGEVLKADTEWNKFPIELAEVTNPERVLVFRITDDSVDRDYDVVIPKGVDLEEYAKNPVFLTLHDSRKWPIGKAVRAKRDEREILMAFEFDTKEIDEEADKLFKKCNAGTIRSVSIGFRPKKTLWKGSSGNSEVEDTLFLKYPGCDRIFTESNLREVSLVPIGANKNAMQLKSDDPETMKAIADLVIPAVNKAMQDHLGKSEGHISDFAKGLLNVAKTAEANAEAVKEVNSKFDKILEFLKGLKPETAETNETNETNKGDEGEGEGESENKSGSQSGKGPKSDGETEEKDGPDWDKVLSELNKLAPNETESKDDDSEDENEPNEDDESDEGDDDSEDENEPDA
jgi:HK97 family phage prohead protease